MTFFAYLAAVILAALGVLLALFDQSSDSTNIDMPMYFALAFDVVGLIGLGLLLATPTPRDG